MLICVVLIIIWYCQNRISSMIESIYYFFVFPPSFLFPISKPSDELCASALRIKEVLDCKHTRLHTYLRITFGGKKVGIFPAETTFEHSSQHDRSNRRRSLTEFSQKLRAEIQSFLVFEHIIDGVDVGGSFGQRRR